MDIYHVWCDLNDSSKDLEFVADLKRYLDLLAAESGLAQYRITRRKLGLGRSDLGEFHITLEFEGLAALDETFGKVAARSDPIEPLHRAVYSKVRNLSFALTRDFPDAVRGSSSSG